MCVCVVTVLHTVKTKAFLYTTMNDMEQGAMTASALSFFFCIGVFAHEEGDICAFVSPSTQQIESHDAHILLDLWEKSVMM